MKLKITLFVLSLVLAGCAETPEKPNIILIITDDQGYGDLGINGNPHLKTPVIDKLAGESIVFDNFYVTPVCATTRASLMTGRYSLRTGIRDTYNGGAIMATSETTLAELLKKADYKTGIFGKWHLGDNYPSRPNDQGFDESVIHLAGGMGQVGDITTFFKGDSSYFNPVLWHNGQQEAYNGYCSDIFTDEAIRFVEANSANPFFCYLSFNAPHTPLQVPDSYYQIYKDIDPASGFQNDDRPFVQMSEKDKEDARKVYAMVNNIDDNMGRLFEKLDELQITDNTLIIFMTDNGPQQIRYVAGMRARKGSVFNGGVRVPLYMKYPKLSENAKTIGTSTAVIDLLPTIAALCNLQLPDDRVIDGQNLLPLINDEPVSWADRSLFFYWTRRYPELYNNIAILAGDYKLVGNTNYNASIEEFELFNIAKDPYEQKNIIGSNPDMGKTLKNELDDMYRELITSEHLLNPPLILVGTEHENPIILNRNDADGERGIWAQEEIFGQWHVNISQGNYDVKFKFVKPVTATGKMFLETGTIIHQANYTLNEEDVIEMKAVGLPEITGILMPYFQTENKRIFPLWVEMTKTDI